eukprot:TRINITY_DN50923_c0_g1_i1.p1 TRINITY_DN50923_c0_g1~~TRINITY_DN50923_c0_g1_i1.p1  ORF type:complete len:267 (+),score=35.04 TRINITY_DN50923_c0_g1_i1:101-901(+)
MRNIALLEWGPPMLFYSRPKELIKVRSKWLEGGPILPLFHDEHLDSLVKTDDSLEPSDLYVRVRYILSAHSNLNSAIKNLRRCFGFTHSEYVGYLNVITKKYRVRPEHHELLDLLRRWAMQTGMDAMFWIDYAKPVRSQKFYQMGPHHSVPYNDAHLQFCEQAITEEAGWAEIDDEHVEDEDEDDAAGPKTRLGLPLSDIGNARRSVNDPPAVSPRRERAPSKASAALSPRAPLSPRGPLHALGPLKRSVRGVKSSLLQPLHLLSK